MLRIGAMTTQAEVIGSDLLSETCPVLKETAETIADPQVRYRGTIGGNVANGDPGNDMPALMMCLDASYVLRGPERRADTLPARDFYEAAYFTALKEDEVLTEIRIPVPPAGHGHAYAKMKRKVGDYATAAAAVVLTLEGGTCKTAAIALTNVGQTPLFAEAAGQALVGTAVDDAAIDAAVTAAIEITDPVDDMRGPPDFRRHVAGVMTRRAIQTALSRAKGRGERTMDKMPIEMTVNGQPVERLAEPRTLLIHFLRDTLDLTGPHIGCDTSHCGACTVDMTASR